MNKLLQNWAVIINFIYCVLYPPPADIWLIKKWRWCNLCVGWLFWLRSMPRSIRSTHVTRHEEDGSPSGSKLRKISFWKIWLIFFRIIWWNLIGEENPNTRAFPAKSSSLLWNNCCFQDDSFAANCGLNSGGKRNKKKKKKRVHLECGRSGRVQG